MGNFGSGRGCARFGNGFLDEFQNPIDATFVLSLTDGEEVAFLDQQHDLEKEIEEAAASLGANRLQTFCRILFPALLPSLLTGFALAFARAVGEYGSVVFISGNMPMKTEITPLLIMTRLEQFDYAGAAALGSVMLFISFILLLLINLLQHWSNNRHGAKA